MNLGTLNQKEQICIACTSYVSMNVCVLSRGLQVSVFSLPSEEKQGATMDEFVCISNLFNELLSNLRDPGCLYFVGGADADLSSCSWKSGGVSV